MGSAVDPKVVSDILHSQFTTYADLALFVVMVYDWLILFDHEVEHVWRHEWGIGKVLFIISRYVAFLDIPITVVVYTAPYGALDYGTCSTLYKIGTWGAFFGISISESILLLRTHAIYSGSKRVTIPLSIFYAISVVAGIIITWSYLRTARFGPPPNSLFNGCYLAQEGVIIFFDVMLLVAIELVVVILTVRKGFREFYSGTPLMRAVYRDSVSFFLILFAVSLSAILVLALAPSAYGEPVITATRIFHSIISCRILLNLKGAAAPKNTSTAVSTILAFAAPAVERTDQAEVIQLVVRGTQDNVEVCRSGMAGTPSQDRYRLAEEAE